MQTRNPFLDDIARVVSGAAGAAGGVREKVEGRIRAQFERILSDMDVVTRDEFEAVEAMAARAREEQEALQARVAALEARLVELATEQGARSGKTAGTAPAATEEAPNIPEYNAPES